MLLPPPISPNHQIVTDPRALSGIVNACKDRVVAFDFETSGLRWWGGQLPVGYSLSVWPEDAPAPLAWYVAFDHRTVEPQRPEAPARAAFADVMNNASAIVAHNAKFDLNTGRAGGWDTGPTATPLHDTMIQAYLIREDRRFKLEKLAEEVLGDGTIYGDAWGASKAVDAWIIRRAKTLRLTKTAYLNRYGHAEVPVGLEGEYSCRDAAHCLYLHAAQHGDALAIGQPHEDQRAALYHNEMLLVRALADMEYTGQRIDTDRLSRLKRELEDEQGALATEMRRKFGTPAAFRWGNDNDVRDLLFTSLGLPVVKASKKTGEASVDRSVLLVLDGEHEGVADLMEWRELEKVRTTYTDSLIDKVDPNGRLHASFVQHGTDTGRLSSRGPNLQNIPVRSSGGKRVREAFVTDNGQARIYCDYSQIELRLLAWITGCRNLTEAYDSRAYMGLLDDRYGYESYRRRRVSEPSTDVHGVVAQSVFGADPADGDWKKKRRAAKIINFGVPYGAGPKLLSDNPQLRLSDREARKYFNEYHRKNPEIATTKQALFRSMLGDKWTRFVNWAGRTRHGPGLRHPNERIRAGAERAMFASLVQGSAAELTRFSIVRLWTAQQNGELPGVSTSTVHDEVQVDCQASDAAEVARKTQAVMEDFTGLFGSIPVIADLEITHTNWAEKEDYNGNE